MKTKSEKLIGLEKAYHILNGMTSNGESFPYTKKIIGKIVEEARREREVIKGLTRNCNCRFDPCICRM